MAQPTCCGAKGAGDCNTIGRVSYIRIYLCYLFPVKDGKLSTGVNATFHASCYG